MQQLSRFFSLRSGFAALALVLLAGCTNETNSVPTSAQSNVYLQVDRLGRPGIKEIFEPFADHNSSDRAVPSNDTVLENDIAAFPTNSGGSSGSAAVSAFYPDVLKLNLSGSSASYLAIELGNSAAFGGRALTDDVMSADLNAAFGNELSGETTTKPCVTTDNVKASSALTASSTTFPYLASPQ